MNLNIRTLFDHTLSNSNYLLVYMKVNYICILLIFVWPTVLYAHHPKIFVSSLFTQVKKRNILCSGDHVK